MQNIGIIEQAIDKAQSKGIMTERAARKSGVGGEILCTVQ